MPNDLTNRWGTNPEVSVAGNDFAVTQKSTGVAKVTKWRYLPLSDAAIAALLTKAESSHNHTVAALSDASANGRSLIKAANYATMLALLGIEAGASADMTPAEIRAAVNAATDSNVLTDALLTKLNSANDRASHTGTQLSSTISDLSAGIQAAGALMDSEVTNLAAVKSFNPASYATAAQGAKADSALQSGANVSELVNDAGYLKSLSRPVRTATTVADTLTTTDWVVLADDDTAGSGMTINLPVTPGATPRDFVIKKLGTTSDVVVNGNGFNIDGAPTAILTAQYESITLAWNGTAYYII